MCIVAGTRILIYMCIVSTRLTLWRARMIDQGWPGLVTPSNDDEAKRERERERVHKIFVFCFFFLNILNIPSSTCLAAKHRYNIGTE